MGASHVTEVHSTNEIPKANTGRIWTVFWILLGITAVEFAIAFAKGPLHLPHLLVVSIFVGLTIIKAFYIVAEFMHLGHETKSMIWSIILPLTFVVWLIVALLKEGDYTHEVHVESKMTTTVPVDKKK
ncbi:MAG TPA: cytochrome C oxidase subunit IV family protein [Cytophagales bacterium]|nr:cytochrome C oxidase subunit IV family protein [Cytophagales bacterium]